MLDRVVRANAVQAGDLYTALDCAATADWLIANLSRFAAHPVEAIIPVAHGAAVVGIRNGVLAFVPLDYEWDLPADMLAEYRTQRDPFALTGSPALPAGLNIGSQLHFLESRGALQGAVLLPYAQYWAWLLCGEARSEVTSLGCHSDLWVPGAGDFSPLATRCGWAAQFAPMASAGEVIGTLKRELAALTGLSPQVRIYAGLHDSNAALVAARGFAEIAAHEATVLSTGTWFVAMRTPGEAVDLATLPETRDCLVNVDVAGRAIPSARYMGGRELELLGERIDVPGCAGLAEVVASGAMLLPSQVPGCGPFPTATPRWIAEPAAPAQHTAAVALYAALMADTSLDLIGAKERLLIEGRFAASELFARALTSLRPDTQVFAASAEADVSFGALRLIYPDLVPSAELHPIVPLDADLATYRAQWHQQIQL